jgi:lactoylglutathione lyase
MKGLAFVKDPDGYLIEILPQGPMAAQPVDHAGVAAEGGEGYKDNAK